MTETSTKPYLIRAIHEWCTDNGFRPYLAVAVDERTIVPREFVRNGEIVLNMSADATSGLRLGNEMIEFEARFNRVARAVSIPVENVTAVYAAENGHGMAFDVPKEVAPAQGADDSTGEAEAHAAQPSEGTVAAVPRGPVLLEAVPPPARATPEPDEPPGPPEPPPAPTPGTRPKLTRIK